MLGIPPLTPLFDQLMALLGLRIPDHCCARTASGVAESKIKQIRSLFMRRIYILFLYPVFFQASPALCGEKANRRPPIVCYYRSRYGDKNFVRVPILNDAW